MHKYVVFPIAFETAPTEHANERGVQFPVGAEMEAYADHVSSISILLPV